MTDSLLQSQIFSSGGRILETSENIKMHEYPDNLGLVTDLLLHAETGIVESKDDYIVVRTPESPDYFDGNMLILPRRPAGSDLHRLEDDFARLVGAPPLIAHRTFGWDETEHGVADLSAFVDRGYEATICRVLAAQPEHIRAVTLNASVDVRRFETDADWDIWTRMQLADMPNPTDGASLRYMAYQQAAYRKLIARGLGDWWGAFIDGEQVGSLGLFFLDGVGRFQSIVTRDQDRNKRVCKTLVSQVIRLTAGRSDRLVMVADEAYHAGKIYEALGFEQRGRIGSLCLEPR
jgi:hypothetical protein